MFKIDMAMKKLLILILLGFIVSCNDDESMNGFVPHYRSFISYYEEPDGIYCKIVSSGNLTGLLVGSASESLPSNERHKNFIQRAESWPEINRLYDSICEANNDMSFNNWSPSPYPCIHRKIESLHIISDQDYDAEHPAGTYLDDILSIQIKTAYEFIQNGYSWKGTGVSSYGIMEERLDVFNSKNRKLLQCHFSIKFLKGFG